MIKGVGLDLCGVSRMEPLVAEGRFLLKYYTPQERAYILSRGQLAAQSAAGIYAAKEAFVKALGTGIGPVALSEVEVSHTPQGQPVLILHGKAAALAHGLTAFVSISHENDMAAATVILEGSD